MLIKKGYNKKCIICEKIFYVTPNRAKAKYCSQKCNAANKKKPDKNCETCNKKFKNRRPESRFCSPKCKQENQKKGKTIPCLLCGKIFYEFSCKIKENKNNFCCWDHSNEWSKRNKIQVTCNFCNKVTSVSKSRSETFIACSKNCLSKITENNLEKFGYNLLLNLKINFIPQHVINKKFRVDAFIPVWNMVVQFDGDYWHGNPTKYPIPNTIQIKNIKRDKSHDLYMKKCGFEVYRIWESEIKTDKFKEDMTKYLHGNKKPGR